MRYFAILLGFCFVPLDASATTPATTIDAGLAPGTIHRGEAFGVRVRVTNTSSAPQKFRIMSCSWAEQWRSNDPQIASLGWACDKNFETTLELAPGAIDTRTLQLTATDKASLGAHTLRVGFTPIGAAATLWSPEFTVQVAEVAKDLAITSTTKQRETTFKLANTTKQPIEIREQLTVQRYFEYTWTDLSPLSASACAPNPPACTTIAPGKHATPMTWAGTVCAQCDCSRNGPAQPGTYRLVAHACDGKRDYVSREITLADH
jgi:hypothetical protein